MACPTGTSTTSRSTARLSDLEAVVDAAGLDRFALLGMSGGSAVALAYAIAHPDRRDPARALRHRLRRSRSSTTREGLAEEETYRSMIRVGWAKEDPVFRRVFTTRFIPDATEEQMRWFDELQRMSTSPENAVASRIGRQQVDIADELRRITAPTLILQAAGDRSTTSTTRSRSRARSRVRGSCRSTAATTSCSPTSRPGRPS